VARWVEPSPQASEEIRRHVRYDPERGEFWWLLPRQGRQVDGQAGSVVTTGKTHSQTVRVIFIDGRKYYAHQIAWFLMTGRWIPEVDHVNQEPLDNRWSNLRAATRSEQNMNRKPIPGRLTGASFHKPSGRWQAYIKKDKKTLSLGYFDTAEEAHEAYLEAAKTLFGGFRRR
jgi:hypothetical protein